MYNLFCTTFTGYQSTQGLTTRFQPCASTLSPTLLPSISLSFYPSTSLPDTSVHPRTHASSVFLSSELSHLVKEHSPLQAKLNGTYCLILCAYFCPYGPFNCISFHKFSAQLSVFSHCSSCIISALLVLSTMYLSMGLIQP